MDGGHLKQVGQLSFQSCSQHVLLLVLHNSANYTMYWWLRKLGSAINSLTATRQTQLGQYWHDTEIRHSYSPFILRKPHSPFKNYWRARFSQNEQIIGFPNGHAAWMTRQRWEISMLIPDSFISTIGWNQGFNTEMSKPRMWFMGHTGQEKVWLKPWWQVFNLREEQEAEPAIFSC